MGSLNAGPLRLLPPSGWSATEPLVGTDAVVLAPHTTGWGFSSQPRRPLRRIRWQPSEAIDRNPGRPPGDAG